MTSAPVGALGGLGTADTPVTHARLRLVSAVLIGALLLFAVVMKFATGDAGEIAIGVAELAVAVGLVALRRSWVVWALVAAMFGGFAGWTGFLVYWDAPSCGCFGNLVVPPSATLVVDLGALLLAASMASLGAGPEGRFTGVLTAAAAAGVIGVGAAYASSDPRPQDYEGDAFAQLLAVPGMEDVASASPVGPAWYLYLFDPECPLCVRHLPQMRGLESTTATSDRFRVKTVDIIALEAEHGVPSWAWGATPVTLLVQRGEVVDRGDGRGFLDPLEVASRFDDGAQYDPLRGLSGLAALSDIVGMTAPRPAWLVYVYTDSCGPCIDHKRSLEAFSASMPDDEILRIRSFSRAELAELGVPMESWGTLRTAVLFERGKITRGWGAEEIPDPVLLWGELAAGTRLAPAAD